MIVLWWIIVALAVTVWVYVLTRAVTTAILRTIREHRERKANE